MDPSESVMPPVMKVIDALDHPHGNRILRTRMLQGNPPPVSELRNARLVAEGPDGAEVELRVLGFPLFGGEPSDARARATGRVDLVVEGGAAAQSIDNTWKIRPSRS